MPAAREILLPPGRAAGLLKAARGQQFANVVVGVIHVTAAARLAVVDMTGGQEVQAQEFGQEVGIRDVVGVFHPAGGLHPGGVGEDDVIAVILEAVHQPIPVEGGLDGNGGDALLVGCEQLQDGGQVSGQFLVDQTVAAFVHEAAEGVVAVQVNSDHDLQSGSPVG